MTPKLACVLALAVSAGSALASDTTGWAGPVITESALKAKSDAIYAQLIEGARDKGWVYPASQIASGYKRNYEEIRARYVAAGYRIIVEQAKR